MIENSDHREVWVEGPHYRIIPTRFPPINFFERFTPPELMDAAFELESLTNERLLSQVGQLDQIKLEDRVSGPGASVVMAAFTHTGNPSRFTNGDYGVYYAGMSLETAIMETVYHRERFLAATQEPVCDIDVRVYKGTVQKPLLDIRSKKYEHLLDPNPDNYPATQRFGAQMRDQDFWGILYPSVRKPGSECVALFRPTATSLPVQSKLLAYHWNGERITSVYEKKQILINLD